TQQPRNRSCAIAIKHEGFSRLPKKTRELIEKVVTRVGKSSFQEEEKGDIAQRLELFLGLIFDALQGAGCTDLEITGEISAIRENIAQTLDQMNMMNMSEKDINWLREKGLLPVDIFKLMEKS